MDSILLYSMIFCHIIADFNLQGCLADLKREDWWKEHYPDKKYANDYLTGLYMHSFAWSFMIHVPVVTLMLWKDVVTINNTIIFSILFWVNVYFHELTDSLKANSKILNLWQDQVIHMLQIIGTWAVWVYIVKIV